MASATGRIRCSFAHALRRVVALQTLAADLERLEGPHGEELFDIPGTAPADYRAFVIRSNGDVLPTLLVDGYVAGVWRAVEGGIEASAFHCLPDAVWEGLAAEVRLLPGD